jgi:hypothetical protein
MLSFSIKCTKFESNYNNCIGRSRVSTFNAQGLRVIKVVVHVGVVKIYVAKMEALRKNERHDEYQFTTKIVRKISLGCSYFFL